MRLIWHALVATLLLVLLGGIWPVHARATDDALHGFAKEVGLTDPAGFIETIRTLDRSGRLPARYLTKRQADELGWVPGRDLWRFAQGKSIGGDRFANREKRVPAERSAALYEADLDYAGGKRGPKRLIYASDGRRWVTVDHYETFREVPR